MGIIVGGVAHWYRLEMLSPLFAWSYFDENRELNHLLIYISIWYLLTNIIQIQIFIVRPRHERMLESIEIPFFQRQNIRNALQIENAKRKYYSFDGQTSSFVWMRQFYLGYLICENKTKNIKQLHGTYGLGRIITNAAKTANSQ